MNSQLKFVYHIDKLTLIYNVPSTFSLTNTLTDYDIVSTSGIFIFQQKFSNIPYIVRAYDLMYKEVGKEILIGTLRRNLENGVTLEVDNRLLYSSHLHLIHEFERMYGLELYKIKQLDVCCDSNQNLPGKLNKAMHRTDAKVTRRGKFKNTEKGNMILGTKISYNIKILNGGRDNTYPSYYMEVRPSGCNKSLTLRGYDKSEEISVKSHKEYIKEACGFDKIYRLEISLPCQIISKQAKNKSGNWSHQEIYHRLTDVEFLGELFRYHLNRMGTLELEGKSLKFSNYLRLD